MTTRRKFLAKIGLALLFVKQVFAQEGQRRPRFMEMMLQHRDAADPAARPDPKSWDPSTITAAWLGHATVLLNFVGTTILTDPVFSDRIGVRILGLTTLGPQRLVNPPLQPEDLPPIDLILLSHAHMDHLDFPSLRRLNHATPVVMAKNTSDLLRQRGWSNVRELDWGETLSIAGVELEALQVRHFGWRFPWEQDRSRGAWNGRSFNAYRITKNGKHVVFGGDTAYQEYFKRLAERNIPIELAMLPIGAYDPWIHAHASPEQAVQMAEHMNARAILPLHWNTYTLSYEPQKEPIERLKAALQGNSPLLALDDTGKTWKM